ncbi:PWWP domain-containing protein 6-like [Lotus japonicus]|uniref:PWWP domain-containing protein 6-like n=1 Tax=Lotus japonicus TaxID=34305 RepID=UPI0025875B4D|nr:PWWP domain-containing protein 6-like [Lotus japonicus]
MGTVETGVSSPLRESPKVQGSEKEKTELREGLGDLGIGKGGCGGVPENGGGLSSCGEQSLGGDDGVGVVGVVKSSVVETEVSVLKDNGCQVNADSSQVIGFSALLKMQESAALSGGGAEKLDSACVSGGRVAEAAVLTEDGLAEKLDSACASGGRVAEASALTEDALAKVDGEDGREGKTSEEGKKDEECDGKIVTVEVPIVETGENMDVAEDLSDEGYGFSVGDFVWGKIKSHPWWPGRIYDPFDASDAALKLQQKNRLLVAYFGDGTFAWCHPSQLKPFEENFIDMVKQSSSKAFVNAVQEAVSEVGRLLYVKMSHSLVAEKTKSELTPPLVNNFGIKKGVLVPDGGIERLSGFPIEPAELLSQVKHIAEIIATASILELEMLKARLSVFYLSRGGFTLAAYEDPQPVPGLEDITDDVGDSKNAVEAPVQGPMEEIYSTSPLSPKIGDSSGLSGNRLSHRRKQKSIAEIIGEDKDDHPENMEGNATAEVIGAIGLTGRKKRKESEDSMASKSVQKKRKLLLNTEKNMPSDENGDTGGKKSIKKGKLLQSKDKNEENEKETDEGKTNEQNEKGPLSRERKKSKYLSPPFTTSIRGLKQVARETETPEKSSDSSSYQTQDDENKTIDLKKIEYPSEDVLSEIWYAAISPQNPRGSTSDDKFDDFISVFRSSLYREGSLYEAFNELRPGSKRKNPESELGVLRKDQNLSDHESPYDSAPAKRRKETAPSMSRGKRAPETGKKGSDEKAQSAEIFVSFWPGSTLPSRSDVITAFSKYGALNEAETNMFKTNFTARVSFLRASDAEEALRHAENKNPFESCEVTYDIQYPSEGSKSLGHVERSKSRHLLAKEKGKAPATPTVSLSQANEAADKVNLNFIKQKLQDLASMLETADGTSPDFKTKVESEVKGLLEDVNKMVESSS